MGRNNGVRLTQDGEVVLRRRRDLPSTYWHGDTGFGLAEVYEESDGTRVGRYTPLFGHDGGCC